MIRPGIYRHYKGKLYEVSGGALHSETLEEMVVYKALYKNELSEWWVRPAKMFNETVRLNGKEVKRFEFVSES